MAKLPSNTGQLPCWVVTTPRFVPFVGALWLFHVVRVCPQRLYRTVLCMPCAVLCVCSTLCDPYLNLFRGIIPPLGGTLDFSPILAFVLLSVSPGPEPRP